MSEKTKQQQQRVSAYKYKPDKRKREQGILVEVDCSSDYPVANVVSVVGDLLTFRVANATDQNPAFEQAYERATAGWRKEQAALKEAKAKGKLSDDEAKAKEAELATLLTDAFDEAFVDACVLDWHNQEDESGNPWPFSKEAAKQFFADVREVFDVVWPRAQDRRYFRVDRPASVEADAKNS